jgi:hypothetical protein
MVIDLKANEIVKKAGNVQYHNGAGEIKGKLIATNQRLYFKKFEDGMKDCSMEIMPEEIQELLYFKTGIIFNNGLIVLTRDGKELKFVVKKRDSWSMLINKMY